MKLEVVKADLLRETDTISKMDPYVIIETKDASLKTNVLKEAGKHPVWNHSVDINVESMHDDITFIVNDDDVNKFDEVGRATLKLS